MRIGSDCLKNQQIEQCVEISRYFRVKMIPDASEIMITASSVSSGDC